MKGEKLIIESDKLPYNISQDKANSLFNYHIFIWSYLQDIDTLDKIFKELDKGNNITILSGYYHADNLNKALSYAFKQTGFDKMKIDL